jgi:hypothetical protein
MNILLGFVPFLAFALLDRPLGIVPALCTAALLAAVSLFRDVATPTRTVKLLDAGAVALFGGLALFAAATHVEWSLLTVRLLVDGGMLILVLLSLALRQPFTLQYAREQVPPEVRKQPAFLRTNFIITGAWGAAFGVMVLADAIMVYVTSVPLVVTVIALLAAIAFTVSYPKHVKAARRPSAPAPSVAG